MHSVASLAGATRETNARGFCSFCLNFIIFTLETESGTTGLMPCLLILLLRHHHWSCSVWSCCGPLEFNTAQSILETSNEWHTYIFQFQETKWTFKCCGSFIYGTFHRPVTGNGFLCSWLTLFFPYHNLWDWNSALSLLLVCHVTFVPYVFLLVVVVFSCGVAI